MPTRMKNTGNATVAFDPLREAARRDGKGEKWLVHKTFYSRQSRLALGCDALPLDPLLDRLMLTRLLHS